MDPFPYPAGEVLCKGTARRLTQGTTQ